MFYITVYYYCYYYHLANTPGVNICIEGGNHRIVHGELDIVEGGDLCQEGYQPILIDLN